MASEGAAPPPPPPPPIVYRRARSSSIRKRARSFFQDTASCSASLRIAEDELPQLQKKKRTRKTKIHFDEYYSEKPVKRVRRVRIMRHLGLIAPVGSPFSLSQVRSDAL